MTKDAVREKHTEVHIICQDAEEIGVSTEDFDMVRLKVSNFHSMQSVIIAMLKTKPSERNEICKYKTLIVMAT